MVKVKLFLITGLVFLSILSPGYTMESMFASKRHEKCGDLKGCKSCHSIHYLRHKSITSNDCTTCHLTKEETYVETKRRIEYCKYCKVKYYNCEYCKGNHHKCRHKTKTVENFDLHDKSYCGRCHSTKFYPASETPSHFECLLAISKECWTCHGEKPKEIVKIKKEIQKGADKIIYEKEDKIIADCGIYFDTNMVDIKPEYKPVLKKIADYLQKNPNCKLHVVGHADNVWEFAYNLSLSKRRAESVIKALVNEYNVNSKQLIPFGVGNLHPIASNETEEGRAKNRRVEVIERPDVKEIDTKVAPAEQLKAIETNE